MNGRMEKLIELGRILTGTFVMKALPAQSNFVDWSEYFDMLEEQARADDLQNRLIGHVHVPQPTLPVIKYGEDAPQRWHVEDCTESLSADYAVIDPSGRTIARIPGYSDRPSLHYALSIAQNLERADCPNPDQMKAYGEKADKAL